MSCAHRFAAVNESIFARMTRAAQQQNAINLAQGFPDFLGPKELIERMHVHLDSNANQYTRASGHPALVHALNTYAENFLPRTYDALEEITVVNGATEGILCTILGIVNPSQSIVVFEPYYESYKACALMAGAELVGVPLIAPVDDVEAKAGHWSIDWTCFERAMQRDVGLIIINHPHNPTGKIFSITELARITARAREEKIPIAYDGVYEHLVYPPHDREFIRFDSTYSSETIYISSIAKTLSFTGFKIGFVFAPKKFQAGIRATHEAAVFCQPTHTQRAVADLYSDLEFFSGYLPRLRAEYQARRDAMQKILLDFGFWVPSVQGSYFLMAQKHNAPVRSCDDNALAEEILQCFGVALLPVSSFFVDKPTLCDWVRVAFCKNDETIRQVQERLQLQKK